MKYLKIILIIIPVFILSSLVILSVKSRYVDPPNMESEKLKECPETPNCICTEDYPNRNFQPIKIDSSKSVKQWQWLKSAIIEAGGKIVIEKDNYVHAEFITPIFRFVDDFEIRLDTTEMLIHLRSASRVGDYDFGTNLKRINHVLQIYQSNQN